MFGFAVLDFGDVCKVLGKREGTIAETNEFIWNDAQSK